MADISIYQKLLKPNRWFLKTKKVFLVNDQPVVCGLWGRFKRIMRLNSEVRMSQNKASLQAFVDAFKDNYGHTVSDRVGSNLSDRLSQGKTLRLWDVKKQFDFVNSIKVSAGNDKNPPLPELSNILTLGTDTEPTDTYPYTSSPDSATSDNTSLISHAASNQPDINKSPDHLTDHSSHETQKSFLQRNNDFPPELNVHQTQSTAPTERQGESDTTSAQYLLYNESSASSNLQTNSESDNSSQLTNTAIESTAIFHIFGGGNFNYSIASSNDIDDDLVKLARISDFHNLQDNKKAALRNIVKAWKIAIYDLHDNNVSAAQDLANLLSNSNILLQSVVCDPNFADIYLNECKILSEQLTSFIKYSINDNHNDEVITSDSTELMQKFTELSLRTRSMSQSTSETKTIGDTMMYPAMLSAFQLKCDNLFHKKLDSSNGAFLKKLLGTADEFSLKAKEGINPNTEFISQANFKDPFFRHIVNMEPVIFCLRVAGYGDYIDKTHVEKELVDLVDDSANINNSFAKTVNIIVEETGIRQLNAQSVLHFYNFENIDKDTQMAKISFTHCTGLVWNELNKEQKNRATKICQRMANAASDAGLKTEQYLSMMKGVIYKATYDQTYFNNFNNVIDNVAQSMVDLSSTILVDRQHNKMTDLPRTITEKLSLPLANLILGVEPQPDLELLSAVASTEALLRLDLDHDRKLFGEYLNDDSLILPVILQVSRLASRNDYVEQIEMDRLNVGSKFLAQMIDLAPLRMFLKHGLKSNLQKFSHEHHTAQQICEQRDWLKSGPMTDSEKQFIINSDKSRHTALSNAVDGHIQAVCDGIYGEREETPPATRKQKLSTKSLPDGPDVQNYPSFPTLKNNQFNFHHEPKSQDHSIHSSSFGSRLSLHNFAQNSRDMSYNLLSAPHLKKSTYHFPRLSSDESLENLAEPDHQITSMIAAWRKESWENLGSDKKVAVSRCYNRFIAPLIKNSLDSKKVVNDYKMILTALLEDPTSWNQFSNNMDMLNDIFSHLDSHDNLTDAAQFLAKSIAVMAEMEHNFKAAGGYGKFSPEILVASASAELRNMNQQILADFAKNMEEEDIYPKLFMASSQLRFQALSSTNTHSQNINMDVVVLLNDISYFKPLIDDAYDAYNAHYKQSDKLTPGRCQTLLNLAKNNQMSKLKNQFFFLEISSVNEAERILLNSLYKLRSDVYATS